MSGAAEPSIAVVAGIAVAVALAAILCFVAVARLPLRKRVRFARVLGNVFLVVVAAAMILGVVAQYFR